MAIPSASTSISQTAGAPASGDKLVCIFAPCPANADMKPRQFGSAQAAYAFHGFGPGIVYAAKHVEKTGQPFLFVGFPISSAGVVGRVNTSRNTGSSVASVAAGVSGVLMAHEGSVTVVRGGTVGTNEIVVDVSLDDPTGAAPFKTLRVRIGTASSYTIPYVGVTLSLAAGTLVAGDTIITWAGTTPSIDTANLDTARGFLAAQQKDFRTIVVCSRDAQNSTEANAYKSCFEAYKTSNERFKLGRVSVRDRLPQASLGQITARMTGNPTLTFAEVGATGDTITRSAGSWISDGFAVNDWITITGSASNNVSGRIASLTATVITLDTLDLVAEGPVSNVTVVGCPTITFAEVGATGDTITRSRGSWLDDGFRVGDALTITGSASNNITPATSGGATIAALTATVITLGSTDLAAEALGSSSLSITAGEAKAAWMASIESAFAAVNSEEGRINLSAGAGRDSCAFTGWNFRFPAGWIASWREYMHDIHVASWRKSDGPTGVNLYDADGVLVEWDDRVDGGGGTAARFTTLRSYSNGPVGAFVCVDLTRADEGSVMSLSHNANVVNELCRVNQYATEEAIGRSLVLNDNGTGTTEALNQLRDEVNAEIKRALAPRGDGPRASSAYWAPSYDDVLNVPDATINGTLTVNLLGTIYKVATTVKLRSNGQ